MSRRPLRPEEARLWALVARTVRRSRPEPQAPLASPAELSSPPARSPTQPAPPTRAQRPLATRDALAALAAAGVGREARSGAPAPSAAPHTVHPIEPNRKRRIVRAREPIGARLDLHGLDQDRARAALLDFIARAQDEGLRAVLVITGKGRGGETGVLRARTPEWLAEPAVRRAIAGVSQAEARHGGEGALYVALKRKA